MKEEVTINSTLMLLRFLWLNGTIAIREMRERQIGGATEKQNLGALTALGPGKTEPFKLKGEGRLTLIVAQLLDERSGEWMMSIGAQMGLYFILLFPA